MTYSHAHLLLTTCARGCKRTAVCISARDDKKICAVCAVAEEEQDGVDR